MAVTKPTKVDDFIRKHMGDDFGPFGSQGQGQKKTWTSQRMKRQIVRRTGVRQEVLKQQNLSGEGCSVMTASAAMCKSTAQRGTTSIRVRREFQAAW